MNPKPLFNSPLSRFLLSYLWLAAISVGTGLALIKVPILVIGLFLYVGFLFIGIYNWRWSLYGLLIFLPYSGIPILAFYPSRIPILLKDFLFVIPAYIGFLFAVILKKEDPFFPNRLLLGLMFCFGLIVVAQLFNPSLVNLIVGFIGLKVWIFYMPLTVLSFHLIDSQQTLNRLLKLMMLLAIVPVFITLSQFILITFGRMDIAYTFYGSYGYNFTQRFTRFQIGEQTLARIPGIFSSANQNYGFLFSMVLTGVGNTYNNIIHRRKTDTIFLAVIVLCCFLTGTRRAFITIPLFSILLVWYNKKFFVTKKFVIVGMVTIIALFSIFQFKDLVSHLTERTIVAYEYEVKERNIQAFFDEPLGLGTGMTTNAARHSHSGKKEGWKWLAESFYAKAVYELGIPGLIVLILLLVYIVISGFRSLHTMHSQSLKIFISAIISFYIVIIIESSKATPIDWDPINVYFWVFLGIMIKLPLLDKKEK